MIEDLLEQYDQFSRSDEAFAIQFVKKHLQRAKGHWVDPIDFQRYEMSDDDMHFRFVKGCLYPRKLHPKYPPKTNYMSGGKLDEYAYSRVVRALTWETARRDITQQITANVRPLRFEIHGVSYEKSRGQHDFFREDAPPEVKALAANLLDRTNPIWDTALEYANEREFVYKIRKVKVY